MHSALSRWLCPLFGIAAGEEDTTAKVLPSVILSGVERIVAVLVEEIESNKGRE